MQSIQWGRTYNLFIRNFKNDNKTYLPVRTATLAYEKTKFTRQIFLLTLLSFCFICFSLFLLILDCLRPSMHAFKSCYSGWFRVCSPILNSTFILSPSLRDSSFYTLRMLVDGVGPMPTVYKRILFH